MLTLRNTPRSLALLALLMAGSHGGCVDELEPPAGSCEVAKSSLVDCSMSPQREPIAEREGVERIQGYACTGSARPDDRPTIDEGWPQGRICTDRGKIPDTNKRGYCCTEYDTNCALNPIADCPSGFDGFQCRGAYRPETYNPTMHCDMATKRDDLLEFCCSDSPRLSGSCVATAGCPPSLLPWTCANVEDHPRSQELLANKSRSDIYYLTCSIPKVNLNNSLFYCCFLPGIMPPGSTCTQHTAVPDCDPGRFGFACLGPDRPEDSFLPIHCPDPGFSGVSREGYPATLYCCDYIARRSEKPLEPETEEPLEPE